MMPQAPQGSPRPRSKPGLERAIREHRRAALVVNTRSRRGRRHYPAVLAGVRAAGFDLLGTFPAGQAGGLDASLSAAMNLQPDLLIVGGGDGTICEAARRLAYADTALGLIPLGTTNNFARALGIPLTLAGAIGILAGGKVADVDLGRAGDTVFANLVSAGLSAQVAASVPHQLKRVAGRAAYPLTALAALPRHRAFHAAVTAGNQTLEMETHQLNIANGSFHAGRPITGDAGADDRLLLAYRLGDAGRASLITATLGHVARGARRTWAEPAFLAVSELWLETDPPLPLDVDGEIAGCTPVRIALAPEALQVMVHRDFPTPEPRAGGGTPGAHGVVAHGNGNPPLTLGRHAHLERRRPSISSSKRMTPNSRSRAPAASLRDGPRPPVTVPRATSRRHARPG